LGLVDRFVLRLDVESLLAELGVLLGLVCVNFLGTEPAEHHGDQLGALFFQLLGPVCCLVLEELRHDPVLLHLA